MSDNGTGIMELELDLNKADRRLCVYDFYKNNKDSRLVVVQIEPRNQWAVIRTRYHDGLGKPQTTSGPIFHGSP